MPPWSQTLSLPPPQETDRLSYTLGSPLDLQPPRTVGTYYAQPYRGGHAGLATQGLFCSMSIHMISVNSPVLGSTLPPPPPHLLGSAGSSIGRGGSTGSSMGRGGSTGSSPASTSPSPPHCSPIPHHQVQSSQVKCNVHTTVMNQYAELHLGEKVLKLICRS